MKYLVDTNVISELRHPKGSQAVKDRFARLNQDCVFTSAVVFGELTKGVNLLASGKRKNGLMVWLEQWEAHFGDRILSFDRAVAKLWGEMVVAALAKGFRLGVSDGQIASTAIFHGLIVITRNEKHFQATGAKIWNIWERDAQGGA